MIQGGKMRWYINLILIYKNEIKKLEIPTWGKLLIHELREQSIHLFTKRFDFNNSYILIF